MGKRKKKALDIAQFVLNVAGMIPVVGNVADLANAGISAVRGDRVGMALSLMSAIPIVGAAGPIAKLSKEVVGKKGGLPEQLRAFNKGMQKTHLQKTKDGASFILPSLEERMHMMKVGIKKLERKTCSGFLSMNCFTAGTFVQTPNGLIEIERITRGMYVWSQNPETGELGKRRVLSSSESTVRKLYHLQVGGCQLQTTAMHPFMVEGKGFVAAQDLELGDRVIGIQANGRIQVNALEAIAVVYYEEPQKVYNFEVAEWHTYFIEELGILVHNGRKCVGKKPPKVTKKPSANVPKRLYVKGNKERYVIKRGKGKSGRNVTVNANKGFADKIVKPKTSSLSLSNAVVPWGAGGVPKLPKKLKSLPKKIKEKSNRLKYMGKTPGKSSKTGRTVIKRMEKEGKIRGFSPFKQFKASDGEWYPISLADMAHKVDAVTWWNRTGRRYGAKSKEVRKFMLDADNYYLEYNKINRSQGAKLKETYLPPLK